jgi:hypothetical protein
MDYDLRAQARAAAALRPKSSGGKGQAVAITWPGTPTTDPHTGQLIPGTPVVQTGSGIEVAFKAQDIDGAVVQRGDKRFMLSALQTSGLPLSAPTVSATLTETDPATTATTSYQIVDVERIAPAGTAVFYWLQLRK